MSNIAVIGGTGYAGRHIVAEAAGRGHTVLSVARKVAGARVPGVTYVEGTLLDVPSLLAELQGVDAVVVAVAPRGDMEGLVRPNIEALASTLPEKRAFHRTLVDRRAILLEREAPALHGAPERA